MESLFEFGMEPYKIHDSAAAHDGRIHVLLQPNVSTYTFLVIATTTTKKKKKFNFNLFQGFSSTLVCSSPLPRFTLRIFTL